MKVVPIHGCCEFDCVQKLPLLTVQCDLCLRRIAFSHLFNYTFIDSNVKMYKLNKEQKSYSFVWIRTAK